MATVQNGSESNLTAPYTCEQLTVSVGNHSRTVIVSNMPGFGTGSCATAPQSKTVDFSGDLSPGHGPVTTTGHEKRTNPYVGAT